MRIEEGEEIKEKKSMQSAEESAIYEFRRGKKINFTREWWKEKRKPEHCTEMLYIEVDNNPIWEQRFEREPPQAIEAAFSEMGRKFENMSRVENYGAVFKVVNRISPSCGYTTICKGKPFKSKGKQVYVYLSDDYRDWINVKFVDEGSQVALWWSPLWNRGSNSWATVDDEIKGYQYWSYQKLDPATVKKEIEEELEG